MAQITPQDGQAADEDKVHPCPFCASTKLSIIFVHKKYKVACGSCEAFGPPTKARESAIGVWNTRYAVKYKKQKR